MQRLEVSGAVRPIYESLGVKRLMCCTIFLSDLFAHLRIVYSSMALRDG